MMMISELQIEKLRFLFHTLPQQLRGHCMRTGLIMQIFAKKISERAPELYPDSPDRLDLLTDPGYARSFGLYHHLADVEVRGFKNDPALAANSLIAPIFSHSWNANGVFAQGLMDTVEFHNEKWDGSGFPCRLSGNAIPFWARVCAIAESYDNLLSLSSISGDREAMKRISSLAGTEFDPALLQIFVSCEKELKSVKNAEPAVQIFRSDKA